MMEIFDLPPHLFQLRSRRQNLVARNSFFLPTKGESGAMTGMVGFSALAIGFAAFPEPTGNRTPTHIPNATNLIQYIPALSFQFFKSFHVKSPF
jgi:hypothetical protein